MSSNDSPNPNDSNDPNHIDVLEKNVSTLLENGGEPPQIAANARARIKRNLVARFADGDMATDRLVGRSARNDEIATDRLVGRSKSAAPAAPARAGRPLIAVGAGLIALAAGALIVGSFAGHGAKPGDTAATTDALATVTLADGSTYVADRGARVDVLGPRRVRVDGAVLFDVVPGKGTFTVETHTGHVDVLGTKFVVDGEATQTSAAVVRGEVLLASAAGDVTLHAGEQGIAKDGTAPVRGPAPRLSHLVSWAKGARLETPIDHPVHHGTLFARDPGVRSHPPWGEEYPLPLKQLTLDVVVEDQVARVAIDQTFHNEQPQALEGVYRFAVPPDAALQRLAMYVDGNLEESAVVPRMQARRIYEELVYRRVDPALLEWAGTGRLALRVYPIPANDDKRLVLAYTQSLPRLYDDWTLTIPLPETDRPVGRLDATVRVKGCANCELVSPSHGITVDRAGEDAIVHYQQDGGHLGDSFVLHVRDARHAATVAMKTDGADRFLMVRAPIDAGKTAVGNAAPAAYRPRTWVILDDVSASRGADELRAQRELIDALVGELDENDRVAVVAFDVEARAKLAATRVASVDRRALRASLEHEGGVGATDFQVALDAATQALAGVAPDDAMILYLGDGMITSGPRNLDALRAQIAGKAHFVGVGVGDGPDTQTLGALAAATGGYATTFDLADDLGWRAFDLVAALHTARVTDLSARLVDASGQTVPATAYLGAPQLADGEELELVARLAGAGAPVAVELTGLRDGAGWSQRIALASSTAPGRADAGYLPRLWAQRHIAARLQAKNEPVAVPPCAGEPCPSEADLREARDEQIRLEVVALGEKYFLLSRHTSLLVLENDAMYAQYGVAKGRGDTWAPYALAARWKPSDDGAAIGTGATGAPSGGAPTTIPPAQFGTAMANKGATHAAPVSSPHSPAKNSDTPVAEPDDHVQAQAKIRMLTPSSDTSISRDVAVQDRLAQAGAASNNATAQPAAVTTPLPAPTVGAAPATAAAATPVAEVTGSTAIATTKSTPTDNADPAVGKEEAGGEAGDELVREKAATEQGVMGPMAIVDGHGTTRGGGGGYASTGGFGFGKSPAAHHARARTWQTAGDVDFRFGGPVNDLDRRVGWLGGGLGAGRFGEARFGYGGYFGAGDGFAGDDIRSGYGFAFGRVGIGAGGGGTIGHGAGTGNGTAVDAGMRARYHRPNEYADVTEFVPALFADEVDAVRVDLAGSVGSHAIAPDARALLDQARAALAAGIYRWADRQIAIDARHQLGWRRTTPADLVETAGYDGLVWQRSYGELGLDVTRSLGDDDVALSLAAVPFWIADPAHYARFFDVKRAGNDIILSTADGRVAYRLTFDARARLVAIHDGTGGELIAIAWTDAGPVSARIGGEPIAVAYTSEAIADAPAWAQQGVTAGIAVQLPMHPVAYWRAQLAATSAGSVEWHATERQLLAAAAATNDIEQAHQAAAALASHGGLALGDVALASGALAVIDAHEATAILGAQAQAPLGQYVQAQRRAPHAANVAAPGLVGALAQARAARDLARDGKLDAAVAVLHALDGRALGLRVQVAANANGWAAPPAQVVALWESCASGEYTNTARTSAVRELASSAHYDLAADEVRTLVDNLDLTAPPPQLASYQWVFAQSRGGQAAWQIVYARWRDKVAAGASFAHVMALLPLAAAQHDGDEVLATAIALADGDPARGAALARATLGIGQPAWADRVIQPLIAKAPTRELYQLAASAALAQSRDADALADLEHAQDAPGATAGDPAPIAEVRDELGTIIALAQELALQSTGPAREQYVSRGLHWGERWRAIDPGYIGTDEKLGALLLAVGDQRGAWRQLSSAIERDPWSGAGYTAVADTFEREGKVEDALPFWQQAIVIDQTNPTPRLRKAQALIALGRNTEGDALLHQITSQHWHDMWSNVVYTARELAERGHR